MSNSNGNTADPLDDFLQRTRRERRDELLRVANIAAKENTSRRTTLESFIAGEDSSAPSTSNGESSSSSRAPQEMVVEIQCLFDSRPVTNMLRSTRFRSELERVVRASVPSSITSSRTSSSTSLTSSSQRSLVSLPSVASLAEIDSSSETPSVDSQSLQPSSSTQLSSSIRSSLPTPRPSNNLSVPRISSVVPPPAVFVPTPVLPGEVRAPIPPTVERLLPPVVDVDQLRHEQLVHEVTELVHQGIVGNTLQSGFRNVLERAMQEHIQMSQLDGRRPMEALQNLRPSTNFRRNDFSHLGIMAPEDQHLDSSDSVSIISATARAVHPEETSSQLAQQMRQMRHEMREMKSALQLLMDAQLETQRSIRQELSAALHQGNDSQASPARLPTPIGVGGPANGGNCVICLTRTADTVLYRCGHLCMCFGCTLELRRHQSSTPTCPVCRARVDDCVRVYITGTASM